MLDKVAMKRTLLAAAVLTASTGVASAGVYGGLSIGPSAAIQDDVFDFTSSGRALRILGGYRLGRISAEAEIYGNNLDHQNREVKHLQFSLFGKYNVPLGSNFEVFGRAGVQRTSLTFDDIDLTYSGNGIVLGPGIEYRLNFVAASASIRLDYTISYAKTATDQNEEVGLTSGQWMLGFTVGM